MSAKSSSEAEILARIARKFRPGRESPAFLRLGIGDDAALFRPRTGHETVLSSDWSLEGRHFLREKHPADSVGWKCLARALSDLAAMGAAPRCFLLNLAIPNSLSGTWLDEFLGGLRRASGKFACPLAGGDTTRHERVLISITVLGEVGSRHAALRAGAKPGDRVYVSGRLGEAEAGFAMLRSAGKVPRRKNASLEKHLYPVPRLGLGQWLVKNQMVSAMMDLSDGLSSDLHRLCAASGVGARLESQRIPAVVQQIARRDHTWAPLRLALHGGDDYELLFAVRPSRVTRVPTVFRGLRLSDIGEITESRRILLVDGRGLAQTLEPRGWDPFVRG